MLSFCRHKYGCDLARGIRLRPCLYHTVRPTLVGYGATSEGQSASVTSFQGDTPCRRRFFLKLNSYFFRRANEASPRTGCLVPPFTRMPRQRASDETLHAFATGFPGAPTWPPEACFFHHFNHRRPKEFFTSPAISTGRCPSRWVPGAAYRPWPC